MNYTTPYLPIYDLAPGAWYKVLARNFQYAKWNGNVFEGIRYKFGTRFWADELHFDSDPHYGTCKPLRLIDEQDVPSEARDLK